MNLKGVFTKNERGYMKNIRLWSLLYSWYFIIFFICFVLMLFKRRLLGRPVSLLSMFLWFHVRDIWRTKKSSFYVHWTYIISDRLWVYIAIFRTIRKYYLKRINNISKLYRPTYKSLHSENTKFLGWQFFLVCHKKMGKIIMIWSKLPPNH